MGLLVRATGRRSPAILTMERGLALAPILQDIRLVKTTFLRAGIAFVLSIGFIACGSEGGGDGRGVERVGRVSGVCALCLLEDAHGGVCGPDGPCCPAPVFPTSVSTCADLCGG